MKMPAFNHLQNGLRLRLPHWFQSLLPFQHGAITQQKRILEL